MSGHSKWSTIKHKKAKTDAQRGKSFSKIAREIIMAAKLGGGDPIANSRLRLALQKAKEINMPNDNVKRAIQKGCGDGDGDNLEEVTFEAYANYGIALLIETLTDNKNRTVPNIKSILTKAGGNMAAKGAVSYQFSTKGIISFSAGCPEDQIMDIATQSGAENIDIREDGSLVVETDPENFESVKNSFDQNNIPYEDASLTKIPQNFIQLDSAQSEKILKLIEKLEEDDDVQNVYGNFDFSDEFLENYNG